MWSLAPGHDGSASTHRLRITGERQECAEPLGSKSPRYLYRCSNSIGRIAGHRRSCFSILPDRVAGWDRFRVSRLVDGLVESLVGWSRRSHSVSLLLLRRGPVREDDWKGDNGSKSCSGRREGCRLPK